MDKVFIIAEAGANHDRDLQQAYQLIDAAVAAQADAVKFQTYSSETLYSKYTPDFANYTNIPQLIKDLELPREWQRDLKLYCDDRGIEFMSTPCDERAVEELYSLGVKRLKIAGFESTDPRWVKVVASTGLPLVVTVGIGSTIQSTQNILGWIREVNPNAEVIFLHGNNAYPTPLEDINLGQMVLLAEAFPDQKIGISDHTEGILVPPLAIAMGARAVEKHYTLNRALPGPDHPFAIEPMELTQMVKDIRNAEKCLGVKSGGYSPSEVDFQRGRRAVIAATSISKGEILTEQNITTKRPYIENSIPAAGYYETLGKRANCDIGEDEIILASQVDE
jgi:N-acetylneuraminate synthase/N,N'-diacetyllegionaminate synthase